MAYGKLQDTYEYWDLWNKKNRNVEKYFLNKWKPEFEDIRQCCKKLVNPEYLVKDRIMDQAYYAMYVGTFMNMTPSGKYYVPYAHNNVSVKEAAIDELWWEEFEQMLKEEDCWYETSEGSATDILICKEFEPPELSHEDFVRILQEKVLIDLNAGDYLAIPGIYEILAEYYNNDVLYEWEREVLNAND